MKKPARLLACLPLFFLCFKNLTAQQDATDTLIINELQPVTVTAYRLESTDFTTPLSLTHIGANQLQRGTQQLALDESLAGVPGVFVQNGSNFAQDVRVSIRGFGARSAFGIRGVKILVDGFPESTPDGQGQVDAIDPASLTGVDVIRSGTGGLYGNASGGSINFNTLKFNDLEQAEVGAAVGMYGFQKYHFKASGGRAGKLLYALNGTYAAADGYRDHSAMENYLLNGGVLLPIDSTLFLKLVLTYVNSPLAQDPGGLTSAEIDTDRTMAAPNNLIFDTDESLWQFRAGVSASKIFAQKHRVNFNIYHTQRSFQNRLIQNMVELERAFTGGNFGYVFEGDGWEVTAGIDLENQNDGRQRFVNESGKQGEKFADQTESFTSAGFYLTQKIRLAKRWHLLPGLRYDLIRISLDDRFLEGDSDDSGEQNFDAFNPILGLSFLASPNLHFYLNASSNFETPTLTELTAGAMSGGFNADLKPQKSTSFELGTKLLLADGRLRMEAALFRIWLEQEFVLYNNFEFSTAFRNAGTSDRKGIELGLTAQPGRYLFISANYTLSDFNYGDYRVLANDFSGNTMPGIPRHLFGAEIRYAQPGGFYCTVGSNRISEIIADDANEIRTEPYVLAFARGGFVIRRKRLEVEPYFGVNNLFGSNYNANIRINAGASRFYEPAPGRNFYGGLKVRI